MYNLIISPNCKILPLQFNLFLMATQTPKKICSHPPPKKKKKKKKTGGLCWQVHLHWNVRPSVRNTWSFKAGSLSWLAFMSDFMVEHLSPLVFLLQVQGIGPMFKLTVNLQNTSMTVPSVDLLISFLYDRHLYSVKRTLIHVSQHSCI